MSRSIWKGPFSLPSRILSKRLCRTNFKISDKDRRYLVIQKQLSLSDTQKSKINSNLFIWSRSAMILPEFIGKKVKVYNGNSWIRRTIVENTVGHKFGEFSYTKKKTIHKLNKTKQIAGKLQRR